jgi:uncharacterized protein
MRNNSFNRCRSLRRVHIAFMGRAIPWCELAAGRMMASTSQHPLLAGNKPRDSLRSRFLGRIDSSYFPCVGSKAALAKDRIRTAQFGSLACLDEAERVHSALWRFAAFIAAESEKSNDVHSLAALFSGPAATDERGFENLLWRFLQRLHEVDRERGHRWAPDADSDPNAARFSLSVATHPFFVIGLHSGASRMARRFEVPVLVFNSHRQFEQLRADGRYAKMQVATRARDMALQGSINPNLADFGSAPETRQYSGRRVETDWRCPLDIRTGARH